MASTMDGSRFPNLSSIDAYEALSTKDALFQPAVGELAKDLGCKELPVRYGTGTALAYRLGEAVLKVYPPFFASDAALEREVLTRAGGDRAALVPRVLRHGEKDGWSFLLMTRLPGEPIEQRARSLSAAVFRELMGQLGAAVKRLHAVDASGLPRPDPDWSSFRANCRARAVAHHVKRGVAAERASELEDFLADLAREPEEPADALVHTELGPGHVLVDGVRLAGIFDFGEAREGPHACDFAAVGIFITRGDRSAFRAFLDGYGLSETRRGDALVRRLMRHALLHPYGHLTFYRQHSAGPDAHDLWSEALYWFGH